MKPIRVTAARALHDFLVEIEFSDGTQRMIDLEPYLNGPIFEPLRENRALFLNFDVGDSPTISWKNGADIDPYTLYYGLTPEWSQEDDELVAALEKLRAENGGSFQRIAHGSETGSGAELR